VVYDIGLDGERCWFVGDLLLTTHAHRSVELRWTGGPDCDRSRYIQSLSRLLKLPPCSHLLPGHGPAAIGCGKQVVEEIYTEALRKWR
jgi:glyoxylase-like metal-dependent hydrolase (beta-lactamase superfamily II)